MKGALVTAKPATESGALRISYNGSNTGATGMVATGKSIHIGENVSSVRIGIQIVLAMRRKNGVG